jgi:hypothetical protein
LQATGGGGQTAAAASGGAGRRRAGGEAKVASRTPKSTGSARNRSQEGEKFTYALEEAGETAAREIGQWSSGAGGAPARPAHARGEGGTVVREEVGFGLAFIGRRGRSREGVRGGAGRSVAPAPLMARGCGRRPLRGGEEGRAAVGECAGRWSGAPGGEVERRGKARRRRRGAGAGGRRGERGGAGWR